MSAWKYMSYVSAALLPLILSGCCANTATRDYHGIPYCCDRTAGTGTELYCAEAGSMAMEEQAPALIEPAAGDEGRAEKIFRKAIKK